MTLVDLKRRDNFKSERQRINVPLWFSQKSLTTMGYQGRGCEAIIRRQDRKLHRARRTRVGENEKHSEEGTKESQDTRLILQTGCPITSRELAPLKGPKKDQEKENVENINLSGKKK